MKNPLHNTVFKYFKSFEKRAIQNADATICLTKRGIVEMEGWKYVTTAIREKIHHITTCCDIDLYQSTFQKRLQRKFDLNDFTLVYIGSIGPWHSFNRLTLFIKTAYEKYTGSKFKLLASSGRERLEAFIEENKLDRSRFEIKFVPNREVHKELVNTDIGFFFIPEQYSKKASSPTKMGEMLSAGLPIITGANCGDVDELVNTNNLGYILTDFNSDNIKNALEKVVDLSKTNGVKDRCLDTANSYFSIEEGVEKYVKLYNQLIHA